MAFRRDDQVQIRLLFTDVFQRILHDGEIRGERPLRLRIDVDRRQTDAPRRNFRDLLHADVTEDRLALLPFVDAPQDGEVAAFRSFKRLVEATQAFLVLKTDVVPLDHFRIIFRRTPRHEHRHVVERLRGNVRHSGETVCPAGLNGNGRFPMADTCGIGQFNGQRVVFISKHRLDDMGRADMLPVHNAPWDA